MQKLWHCPHRRASLSIQEVQGKGMWESADLQLLDELGLHVGAHGGQDDGHHRGGGGGGAEGAPGHHTVALAAVHDLVVHQVGDGAELEVSGGQACGLECGY